jgi:hypothetical protein
MSPSSILTEVDTGVDNGLADFYAETATTERNDNVVGLVSNDDHEAEAERGDGIVGPDADVAEKAQAVQTGRRRRDYGPVGVDAKKVQATRVDSIVANIKREQDLIAKNEHAIVPAIVRIGVHLAELRREAKKDWAARARKLGLHSREASRYILLGEKWGAQIGTTGSDLIGRFPPDIKILEWVCRLPFEDLTAFLKARDEDERGLREIRKWDRPRYISEVQELLNEPKRTRKPAPSDRALNSFKKAAEKAVAASRASGPTATPRAEILARLQETLVEAISSAAPFDQASVEEAPPLTHHPDDEQEAAA